MSELPDIIPLFPLPNVVFFPDVPLPLHIFEPRYQEMVRDAEASHRLIGMVLLRGDWRKDYDGAPDIFTRGCAGRIVKVETLSEGRSNILLRGLCEFEIESEIRDRTYRQARVRWEDTTSSTLSAAQRSDVCTQVRRFLSRRESAPADRLLDDSEVSDAMLIHLLCYLLELSPIEKQALLEAHPLASRADRLCELIDFTLSSSVVQSEGDDGERCH